MTTPPTPPAYTTGQTVRAVYLLVRGAVAAMVGRDLAGTKWDDKLHQLADKARGRGEDGS
ncbi:MAG: hypothetical protein ACJ786_30245 [Catenulispora sp.]